MEKKWALILGASSGFGGATAVELASAGYNIIGIHTMVFEIDTELTPRIGNKIWPF